MKRLLVSLALALCASGAGAVTVQAGGSETVTLPLWNVLTMTGTGATCVSTRLSDTPGSGQSQGTTAVSGSSVVTVGPYSTSTRHSVACSVGSLEFSYAPAAFVVTGGIIASDIDASDVPADEECLTYEGTGPALEWQSCGSGGGLADGDYGDVTVSGTGTAMAIDADAVTEAMLKATNAATDEYVLTYESTVGDFEWQAAATGTIGGTLPATDNLICRTDGTGGSTIQASVASIADTTGAFRSGDGTTALPTYGFTSDPNTGIYLAGADTLSATAGGVDSIYFLSDMVSANVAVQSYEGYRNGSAKKYCWSDASNPNNSPADTCLSRAATGIVTIENLLHLVPIAAVPRTCDATAEGDVYSDTSHALCWCDGSAWQKLSGAGTCA